MAIDCNDTTAQTPTQEKLDILKDDKIAAIADLDMLDELLDKIQVEFEKNNWEIKKLDQAIDSVRQFSFEWKSRQDMRKERDELKQRNLDLVAYRGKLNLRIGVLMRKAS